VSVKDFGEDATRCVGRGFGSWLLKVFLCAQDWRVPGGSLDVRSYMGLVRRMVKGRSGCMKAEGVGENRN
jgi:hypothetical protein